MAAAQATIVYDTTLTTDQSIQGQLFAGKKFWIGQRTPQRSVYVTKVRSNGGNVVPLEKGADYLICDHLKIDGPPGGISYKFIDQSIRDNALADPNDFLVGPAQGTVRDVGSLRPTKQSRTPFSTQDDAILWIWVRHCEAKGASIKGNEIYKQLEVNHPNHTWQAWRDRYLKTLDKRPEEWKQSFTSQAQLLLSGSNGEGKTMTKRARSNEPGDEHNIPSNEKKQRVNDLSGENSEEEPVNDANISSSFRTGSLQAQARGNTQRETTPPIKAPRCPSPSSQLMAEQEEVEQRSPFRARDVAPSQPKGPSTHHVVIDLTNQSLDNSSSDSSDEEDTDEFLMPEPEGGFPPEIEFEAKAQNQVQTQHPSSPPDLSWNIEEPLTSNEEFVPIPVSNPKRARAPTLLTQSDDDEIDKDEEAVPDFHTLYTSYKDRGYSDAHIATALYATSANPKALELVLEELEAGRAVPQDVSSVWTEEDDDKLLMISEGRWVGNFEARSVVRKHGVMGCNWRKAFLERMRLGGDALR